MSDPILLALEAMRGELSERFDRIDKRLDNLDRTDGVLAGEVRVLGQRMGGFEVRLSRLEEDHVMVKRQSQEGDEMQMAALSSAMHIQSKAMEDRLTKQDKVLDEQTATLTKIVKAVGHPIWRGLVWFIGAAISYYLGTKGFK